MTAPQGFRYWEVYNTVNLQIKCMPTDTKLETIFGFCSDIDN